MEASFKTKYEAIYEMLRKEILQAKIKPGEKIVISDLSKKIGVSEIPIREAVKKLESEGFLTIIPHVGITVCKLDPDEIIEFYLIRIELESLAARLATSLISEAEISCLQEINQELESALQRDDREMLYTLNKKFHFKIYVAAKRPHLYKLIVDLWDKVSWIRSVFFLAPQIALDSWREHGEIIEAIRKRDDELVGKLIRAQKRHSLKTIADRFFPDLNVSEKEVKKYLLQDC
jgi:DNA-binding GntR family transcriptional regulator